jgi:hypothetical protein
MGLMQQNFEGFEDDCPGKSVMTMLHVLYFVGVPY